MKVIFFDAGGTLFRPYPSVGHVYARVAAVHGVTVDAAYVEKIFHDKWHERNGMTTLAGLTSEKIEREWWHHLVRDVFGNLGAFDDFDAFFQELYDLFARAECWRLFDDAIPVLDTLKSKGYRLAIISNWDHRLFSIVDQLGLAGYFEQVIASSTVGTAKPGKKIFEAALTAMQARAEDCLHVGDSVEDDYHGASRAGLKAVLLHRQKSLLPSREKVRMRDGFGVEQQRHPSPQSSPLKGEEAKYNGIVKISRLQELLPLLE